MQGPCVVASFVRLTTKHLCRCPQLGVCTGSCILCKDGGASKTKHHVFLERATYHLLHIAKLRTVALVEDDHHLLLHHLLQHFIFSKNSGLHQICQFLYGGDDDTTIFVFQLFQQNTATAVRVGTIFLKVVILLHGLIVQVLSIYHKEHFLHPFIH